MGKLFAFDEASLRPLRRTRRTRLLLSRMYETTMPIVVQDVPLANQILQRPGLSFFQKAVNLDDLLAALPAADRPSKSYHKPKLLQKLGLPRVYVSKDNDITDSLSLSSLKRNKVVWVPRSDARRLLKSRADELLPLDEVDEVDGVQLRFLSLWCRQVKN